ncbi:MAG: glycosyl hydrolase family 18 protein [Candidatus Berkiellales bacterium]
MLIKFNINYKLIALMLLISLIFSYFLFTFLSPSPSRKTSNYNMQTLFYTLAEVDDEVLKNIEDHINDIDIIAPQCFELDEKGEITGQIDEQLLKLAEKHNKKIMPLLTNPGFNQEIFHTFLQNGAAHQAALEKMLEICQKNRCYGLQFDFENINIEDKAVYMDFYRRASTLLHQHNFAISIAIVPTVSDQPNETTYDKWLYENWWGTYDYKVLAEYSDFVSLMTYDQHTPRTPAGPVAGFAWVEECIKHALKYLKPEQVSVGMPTYSRHWAPGVDKDVANVVTKSLRYTAATALLEKHALTLLWDPIDKIHYARFRNGSIYEYLYVENAESFKAKLALVDKYQLNGISAWRIGLEDQKIWETLRQCKAAPQT